MLLLSGCGTAATASWHAAGTSAGPKGSPAVSIKTPAEGAGDTPTSTEIAFSANNAASTSVALADSTGAAVEGSLRPDGTAWVPGTQLKYGTTYTATVTANGSGKSDTKAVTFTTMKKPGYFVSATTPLDDDQVYGVAMPFVLNFDEDVPKDQRANVERRLFVTSEPAQAGAWHWHNGHEVHYRPQNYWQPGTKISARLAIGGLPLGGNAYGAADVTIRASIGDKVEMVTDNATKTMTVTKNGEVIRQIPVSLGRPGKATSSGHMVIMTKNVSEIFVSTEPGDSYRTSVNYPQRLTRGGEYIHGAYWSEGDQGVRNVSHGCTNVSEANAKWLYGVTHVGDPVTIIGTGSNLDDNDGWTDWNYPTWEDYLKGSALPHPTQTGPSASPSASASPAPSHS
jgi:lipoprotein-anchoring transpeptidase ErfK/SrfK